MSPLDKLTCTNLGRLLFLDNTLKGIIQRFEDEYPETRVPPPDDISAVTRTSTQDSTSTHSTGVASSSTVSPSSAVTTATTADADASDSEDEPFLNPPLGQRSRHASDVSLAAKAMVKEEGAVHKIGQEVKRQFLQDKGGDVLDRAGEDEGLRQELEREHVRLLKEKLRKTLDGEGNTNGNGELEGSAIID
jgi:hypothetical protein